MELEFDVDAIAGVLVVVARGELAQGTLGKLSECLERATAGGRPVVLDLLDVATVDDAGLQLLLDAHDRLGTRLRIVGERGGPVHTRVKEAGFAHALALDRSRATALASSAPLAD
jgi:anti-anti-sigma factor